VVALSDIKNVNLKFIFNNQRQMSKKIHRRDFLAQSLKAGIGLTLGGIALDTFAQSPLPALKTYPYKNKPMEKVRIGIIGVGGMGMYHYNTFLNIKGAEVVAVSDIVEERAKKTQEMAKEKGLKEPDIYFKSPEDYKKICERDDIDLIFTATPWRYHVPIVTYAMNHGKHAATEVPAAMTIDQCWELVETSENTGKHCVMMENCNYDREEMLILKMVKQGVFGELLHAECGYLHDLRAVKYDMNGEGLWRRNWSMEHNGDLYPTHGLGPVAQYMDINRGNYFDYLVSFGTKTRGLHLYAEDVFGPDSEYAKEQFKLGDVVTTVIKTMNGETIVVTHDTSNPRPYSRDILVQGTNGIVRKYPEPKVHIQGVSPKHRWEDLMKYEDQYQHKLWKDMAAEGEAVGAAHGGMDYFENYRLIDALLKGRAPDMDVYDAVMLSAVRPLSEESINKGSMPVKFPDFTRGMWKEKRELEVMKM
jgi:predicted dehydrogenase